MPEAALSNKHDVDFLALVTIGRGPGAIDQGANRISQIAVADSQFTGAAPIDIYPQLRISQVQGWNGVGLSFGHHFIDSVQDLASHVNLALELGSEDLQVYIGLPDSHPGKDIPLLNEMNTAGDHTGCPVYFGDQFLRASELVAADPQAGLPAKHDIG